MNKSNILVAVIMGSKSDWPTMKHTAATLDKLKIKYEKKVVSAHRTPDLLYKYASTAESRGIEIIIAGAGGSAHLPGMTAAKTSLPVVGVPLPLVSYGGTSMLTLMAAFGIMMGTYTRRGLMTLGHTTCFGVWLLPKQYLFT